MFKFKAGYNTRCQKGVALVVSLLLLLILTVIGVAGTRLAVQQDKMATIFVDLSSSFDHAESLRMATGNLLKVLLDDPEAALGVISREEEWAEQLEVPPAGSDFTNDAGNGAMTVFRISKNPGLTLPWRAVSSTVDPFFTSGTHSLAGDHYRDNLQTNLAKYQYLILRPPRDFSEGISDIGAGKPKSIVYWVLVRNIEKSNVILFNKFILYRGSNDA